MSDELQKEKMVTLKQLILETEYNNVWDCIIRHYEIKRKSSIKNFKRLYKNLIELPSSENHNNMYIYINAFKDDGQGDSYCIENFDDNDVSLYFDVSGKDDAHCGYSLVASRFEDWLSFYIDDNTIAKLSYPSIIAHCLWEMTFFGFEQKRDGEGHLIVD